MTRSDWQPIETAPKDGTRVFLWLADEGFPVLGAWIAWEKGDEPGWFLFEMHSYDDLHDVTHWLPLPAAPADTQGGGGDG